MASRLRADASRKRRKLLRGPPGTTVGLTIERPGVAHRSSSAEAARDHVRSVQHAALLADSSAMSI